MPIYTLGVGSTQRRQRNVRLDRIEGRNNGKGYELMSSGQLAPALEIFKLNTMIAPESSNAWDSLAECYFKMKSFDDSLRCYRKSLELNPQNDNAERMIARMETERQ